MPPAAAHAACVTLNSGIGGCSYSACQELKESKEEGGFLGLNETDVGDALDEAQDQIDETNEEIDDLEDEIGEIGELF